jgi:hypothetical protein
MTMDTMLDMSMAGRLAGRLVMSMPRSIIFYGTIQMAKLAQLKANWTLGFAAFAANPCPFISPIVVGQLNNYPSLTRDWTLVFAVIAGHESPIRVMTPSLRKARQKVLVRKISNSLSCGHFLVSNVSAFGLGLFNYRVDLGLGSKDLFSKGKAK